MSDLGDVRRNRALDDMDRAVESAIDAAMRPDDFIQCAWQAWSNVLHDRQQAAERAFRKAQEPRGPTPACIVVEPGDACPGCGEEPRG